MIRRLRWKIVAINMAMVTAVLLAVFVGVLVSSRAAVERTVNQRLMQVVQTGRYDASLPGEGSAAPCFVADVYPSGTVRLSGSSYYRLDDQDAMAEIVTACLEQGDSSGILRSYHLRYLRADGPLYTRIAFTDAAQEDATLRAVVKMCLLVGAAALAVLLGCSYLLSGVAARPVERVWQQQQRIEKAQQQRHHGCGREQVDESDAAHLLRLVENQVLQPVGILVGEPGEGFGAAGRKFPVAGETVRAAAESLGILLSPERAYAGIKALLPDFRGRAVDALEYGVEVEVGRGFGVDRMAGVLRRAVVEIAADQVEVARRALSGGKRRRPEKG